MSLINKEPGGLVFELLSVPHSSIAPSLLPISRNVRESVSVGYKKCFWRKDSSLSRGISSLELAARRPCLLHFDKTLCLPRIDLTSPRVLLNGFLENVWATSMPEAREVTLTAHEETTEVRPIPLSVATCQTEQIEFVFLRCLVGALNSILVALLIKAVKANLVAGEPRRHGSECSWHCTYVNGCQR